MRMFILTRIINNTILSKCLMFNTIISIHAWMYVRLCVYMFACMHACMYTCMDACVHTYRYLCMTSSMYCLYVGFDYTAVARARTYGTDSPAIASQDNDSATETF